MFLRRRERHPAPHPLPPRSLVGRGMVREKGVVGQRLGEGGRPSLGGRRGSGAGDRRRGANGRGGRHGECSSGFFVSVEAASYRADGKLEKVWAMRQPLTPK